jgi:hypothetical protein
MKINKISEIADAAQELTDIVEIHGVSVHSAVEALEKDGWNQDEFESNGFQWDYWSYHSKGDRKIVLSGSGYYGTSIKMDNIES